MSPCVCTDCITAQDAAVIETVSPSERSTEHGSARDGTESPNSSAFSQPSIGAYSPVAATSSDLKLTLNALRDFNSPLSVAPLIAEVRVRNEAVRRNLAQGWTHVDCDRLEALQLQVGGHTRLEVDSEAQWAAQAPV